MPRLGVVAMLPQPVAAHVQAWRRALREPFRDAVAPHLTLVPPQHVPDARVADAVALVNRAAAAVTPTVVELDGAGSFLPRTPVVFLRVARGLPTLAALERGLRTSPLGRRTHPFHPHVTVAQDLTPPEIERTVAELAGFHATFPLDHIWLMVEEPATPGDRGPVWRRHHRADLGRADPGTAGASVRPVPLADAEVARVLLTDGDRVLLGQRTPGAGREHPGAWDALGAGPAAGEPLLAACARGLRDQAGVEPLDLAVLGCWHDGGRATVFHVCTRWRGEPRNTDPGEHTRLEWVALDAVGGLAVPPTTRAALACLRAGPGVSPPPGCLAG